MSDSRHMPGPFDENLDRVARQDTQNDGSEHKTPTSRPNANVERDHGQKNQEGLIAWRGRVVHTTWAWFTCTMSTGGLSIALAKTPHRFPGLYIIGLAVFILDLILFLLVCVLMMVRLFLDGPRFRKSFVHPPEGFFFASFILSLAVVLGNVQLYWVTLIDDKKPWLISAICVVYWIYAGVSMINAIQQYWAFIQRTPRIPVVRMNPSWFLPGFSAMLTGAIASIIAETQPPAQRVPIIISGCAFQGFGWLISSVFIAMYVIQLMENGLPPRALRPGMFLPVGSAAFTIVALIGQARAIPKDFGYFASHPSAADTLQTVALFVGIFLWLFAFWMFSIAVLGVVTAIPKMVFTLTWWALVFPNVGFTLATIAIGTELDSPAILWVGSGMTICLVLLWLLCAFACGRAVLMKRIMWPGKDEDRDM
ncbi:hypothetical protein K504DRAFT_437749 [Pleomassaria siparia CBS 279.74]|uniref:C4-dicarboxylate transporter/malic acid transport protein n=1 Tax=Pleomassaria siparia CBS 279.74 TaxID=1314801 RepID=A0A6G1K1Y9_9PLEO|nr:hypothetical protein K504DRAFT_437749 [Pleomassaria siparia CBS 279.74]